MQFIGFHKKQLPWGTPVFRASAIAFRSWSLSLCLCLLLSLSFSPLSPPLPSSNLFFSPPSPSLPQLSSTYLCLASYSSKQAGSLYVESNTPLTSPSLYPLTDWVRSERKRKYLSQRFTEVSDWPYRDRMLISKHRVPWLAKSRPHQGHTQRSTPWDGVPGREVARRA